MQNPVPPDLTFGITVIVLTLIGAAALPFEGMSLLTTGGVIVIYFTFDRLDRSNYKDSPVLAQIAKLFGFKVHECGCLYRENYSRHETNIPDGEWIEQEEVYERSMEGAKIHFVKKQAGMKRCTQCGNHYHTIESFNNRRPRKWNCWPEDEPDIREQLDYRVVES